MLFLTYISLLPPTGINRKDTVTDSVDMVERQIETDKNEDRKFAIRTNNLTKRYGDTVAVDDLNLHVPTGEVYGFLGPNGAGKTTTMRLLTGLVAPDAGELSIAGTEVSGTGSVINVVGYAPTDPPVYDLLTGREQLHYLAELRELNIKNTDRIEKLLQRFELTDAADDRIETYSKGMRQKIGVIQAILHEPPVLLLDEPTSGLDPQSSREMRRLLTELTSEGQTVFLSTHVLSVVDDLADTVGVLHNGCLVAEESPEEFKRKQSTTESETLEDVFIEITTDKE